MPAASNMPDKNPAAPHLRIAVGLWDWSQWCRSLLHGVQSYAHDKPNWRIHAVVGPEETRTLFRGPQYWDGIISPVLRDVPAICRMVRSKRTKIVSCTAVPPVKLLQLPAVRVNDIAVAQAIGKHLMAGGFRQFAYDETIRSIPHHDFRRDAVIQFAQSVDCPLHLSKRRGSTEPTSRELRRWVKNLPKPIGIFAWSMAAARTILNACAGIAVAVPEQVAVVAWDDDVVLAESVAPTISAAVLPTQRLGYEAAKLMDRLLSQKHSAGGEIEPVIIEPSGMLQVRQSSDVNSIPDRVVHLAAQYIREHAAENIRVTDVIRHMRVSQSKLERDFKRVMDKTLNAAIVDAHIERACQFLVETRWPMEKISARVGFGTKRHFHRAFAAAMGSSPAEYRKRFSL